MNLLTLYILTCKIVNAQCNLCILKWLQSLKDVVLF